MHRTLTADELALLHDPARLAEALVQARVTAAEAAGMVMRRQERMAIRDGTPFDLAMDFTTAAGEPRRVRSMGEVENARPRAGGADRRLPGFYRPPRC